MVKKLCATKSRQAIDNCIGANTRYEIDLHIIYLRKKLAPLIDDLESTYSLIKEDLNEFLELFENSQNKQ
ncbi:MAG: hypothetical protein HPY74_11335 [Firmicutes bacterium]|nr:hypothetical protein [Bacillota bacterium]